MTIGDLNKTKVTGPNDIKLTFLTRKVIDKVEVNVDENILEGKTISLTNPSDIDTQSPTPNITLPSGVNYKLKTYRQYWVKADGSPFAGTYKLGDTVYVYCELDVTNGYMFDPKCKIDGNWDIYKTDWTFDNGFSTEEDYTKVKLVFSMPITDPLQKIDLSVDVPVCGTEVECPNMNPEQQTNAPVATVDAAENFTLHPTDSSYWMVDDRGEVFTGTLEGGTKAMGVVYLQAKDGYSFDPNMSMDDISIEGATVLKFSCSNKSKTEAYVRYEVNIEHEPDTELTCDETVHGHVCKKCGKLFDPVQHEPSEWIVDAKPEVGKDGSQHKECLACKRVLTQERIPALTPTPTPTATPTATPTGAPSPSPKTGETSSNLPMIASSCFAMAGIAWVMERRRKHNLEK